MANASSAKTLTIYDFTYMLSIAFIKNAAQYVVVLLMRNASSRKPWVRSALLAGVVYFVVGYGSAAFDPSVSDQNRFTWRLAAWVVSAIVFAAHIGHEHFWLGNSPRSTAFHAATAVAIGAVGLAMAATIHALLVPSTTPFVRFLLAWIIWPAATALPAFLVAYVAVALLEWFRSHVK
jgi:hypothetical protein